MMTWNCVSRKISFQSLARKLQILYDQWHNEGAGEDVRPRAQVKKGAQNEATV